MRAWGGTGAGAAGAIAQRRRRHASRRSESPPPPRPSLPISHSLPAPHCCPPPRIEVSTYSSGRTGSAACPHFFASKGCCCGATEKSTGDPAIRERKFDQRGLMSLRVIFHSRNPCGREDCLTVSPFVFQ